MSDIDLSGLKCQVCDAPCRSAVRTHLAWASPRGEALITKVGTIHCGDCNRRFRQGHHLYDVPLNWFYDIELDNVGLYCPPAMFINRMYTQYKWAPGMFHKCLDLVCIIERSINA